MNKVLGNKKAIALFVGPAFILYTVLVMVPVIWSLYYSLYAGSPGHVVMVVDVCRSSDGKKAFLLGQGFMPAQEFHLLKNPLHEDNPWYYLEEVSYPLQTPEYSFKKRSFRRLEYLLH